MTDLPADFPADALDADAATLATLIRHKTVSAVEVMQRTLDRIERRNPALNAIVSMADPERLLAEAGEADAGPPRGPLHGLPLAVKDLADAAGFPTSMGSPLFVGQVAARDEIHVARLRAAGAIVVGKTNAPEFGLGSHTFNPVFGPTRNPWDRRLSAGGSSGGAAAALAAGLVPLADGSDMMGSLRNPAGWCHVWGLRPTWGLVPSEPEGDLFLHQLSTNGPMGRSVADLALSLSVMAGPDPRQPHDLPRPDLAPLDVDVAGVRIGWLGDWGGAFAMEDDILATCEGALSTFAALGCEVAPTPPPFPEERLWQSWTVLRSFSVAAGLSALMPRRDSLKPEAVWEVERGLALSAIEVQRASSARSDWFRAATALFDRVDVLALPSAQVWPFAVGRRWPDEIAGRAMDTYHGWMEVVVPASLIGLPALSVPAGFGPQGLPMGLQLVGRRGADRALLQLGRAWERATGPLARPPA